MATNSWQDYVNAVKSKNYAGSSGYWGDTGGAIASRSFRPGLGMPGDRSKAQIANAAGVNAGGTVGELQQKTTQTGTTRPGGSESLYKPVEILKSFNVSSGVQKLMDTFNKGADAIPGFDQILRETQSATSDIKRTNDRERTAYDLTGYSAEQRAADAAAGRLTEDYANTGRRIGAEYRGVDDKYANSVRDIISRADAGLTDYDRAADNIGGEQIGRLLGQVSRYKIAGGNLGLGSDELRRIARGVGDIRLPLERDKIQRRYDLLTGLELPANRELASRDVARLTGYDAPLEQGIYGARTGDVMRSKGTSQQLQQLSMAVAGMDRARAESYLRSLSLPAQVIQEILQRHNQTLGGQITNLAGIGSLEDQAYYRGLEYTPGANLSQPRYYPSSTPNRYPDDYPTLPRGNAPLRPPAVNPSNPSSDRRPVIPVMPEGYFPQPAPFNYRDAGAYPDPMPAGYYPQPA